MQDLGKIRLSGDGLLSSAAVSSGTWHTEGGLVLVIVVDHVSPTGARPLVRIRQGSAELSMVL